MNDLVVKGLTKTDGHENDAPKMTTRCEIARQK